MQNQVAVVTECEDYQGLNKTNTVTFDMVCNAVLSSLAHVYHNPTMHLIEQFHFLSRR